MSDSGKQTLSFGFSKKTEKKVLLSNDQNEVEIGEGETDYITAVEGQKLKSTRPKEEQKELVIPLIKKNAWKTKYETATDGLDSQAVSEIIQDAVKQNENWDTRGKVDSNLEIPLLMQNKVPDGFETDDHLDVSLRPDEPEDASYEEVPIEQFGLALLKGMGWKPGDGIGRNNKAVKPVEAVLRPKGMGLGADRKQAQDLNSAKQGGSGGTKQDESPELRLKKGAYCLVENGTHKDLYGLVEGMDEDNARLMIKLTVSGKLVTVSQYNIKLVTAEEYNKFSKYINKGAADRYKEKEKRQKEKESEREKYSDRGRDGDRTREHRHRKEDDRLSPDSSEKHTDKSDRKKKKYRGEDYERSNKKRKYEKERSPEFSSHGNGSTENSGSLWVRANLRVRLIDEHYRKGKYYNSKVVIVDVFDKDHCVCKTEEGKVLEDISQSMLETMVPKSESAYVCIVSGKYRGQLAHVMERNKKKYEVLLQLLSDRDKVLRLHYDSICEYVGDINEEFDY